ncbi:MULTISPECIES: hypothetical protein [unclassified Streptomyces]|uniref:hypothetical protein n=1 Tax=unclassified Streptomyces TaxID=2593676 RepID=UPI002E2DA43A|nr:hypothetical protein [Streptomyces sp. NBC_00223]
MIGLARGGTRGNDGGTGGLPPTDRWRRRVLTAPGLAVLGVLLLIGTAVVEDRHGKRAGELCHHLPVPWTLYLLAYAALVCGVAATVGCALFLRAAARDGRRGLDSWQGTLALCICVANLPALLFEAVALYGVHAEAAQPYWQCSSARASAAAHVLAVVFGA